MSSRRATERVVTLAGLVALAAVLSGCSDIYFDRRETIALGAGDAVAANKAVQMVDPWPRHSENKNIAFNGERLQGAVERYRRHEAIQPRSPLTTNVTTELPATTTERIQTTRTPPAAPATQVK